MRAKSIDLYASAYKVAKKQQVYLSPAENLIRAISINKIAPKGPHETALDFGCGDGRHTKFLHEAGYQVFATDVSKEATDVTQDRFDSKAGVKVAYLKPGNKIAAKNDAFDLVVCWETMHWLGSKKSFLFYVQEFRRVLKKNGTLILTMPTEEHYIKHFSLEIGESQYLCKAKEREDTVFYSPNLFSLKSILLSDFGFKLKAMMKYCHARENDSTMLTSSLEKPFSQYIFVLK